MAMASAKSTSIKSNQRRNAILINLLLVFICFAWTIPTFGLLVSSFRLRDDIAKSGWWSVLPHREWRKTADLAIPAGLDRNKPMTIEGVTATFEAFRAGVETSSGTRLRWLGNRRTGKLEVQEQRWMVNWDFTTENYNSVLTGQRYRVKMADGTEKEELGEDIGRSFLNTATVSIPATVIPILIAAFAAYAFAWLKFPLKRVLFAGIVALLVVPLQAAMIPMLRDFKGLGITGTFMGVWLAHTTFGLPLATYLLYNYISQLPRETLEAAFMDGASPFTTFTRLILPLSVPALASFAIFQFMWVWNDYLVSLIFLGGAPAVRVMTMRLADMVGTRGQDWHLLTSGAFITMLVPLIVFFSLQRYFVRGLLAGSVKG